MVGGSDASSNTGSSGLRWKGISTKKAFMTGFPSGGQFLQRFMYLHSERLLLLVLEHLAGLLRSMRG